MRWRPGPTIFCPVSVVVRPPWRGDQRPLRVNRRHDFAARRITGNSRTPRDCRGPLVAFSKKIGRLSCSAPERYGIANEDLNPTAMSLPGAHPRPPGVCH